MRNIVRNTHLRPIRSESQAHRKRPAPLAIEMMLTSPAATMALTPVTSWAIGDASEMIEMPATTLRNSSAQRAHHCQVRRAPRTSKSLPERSLRSVVSGSQPSGFQPSGGLESVEAAAVTTIR
jgi:hypothetical protein